MDAGVLELSLRKLCSKIVFPLPEKATPLLLWICSFFKTTSFECILNVATGHVLVTVYKEIRQEGTLKPFMEHLHLSTKTDEYTKKFQDFQGRNLNISWSANCLSNNEWDLTTADEIKYESLYLEEEGIEIIGLSTILQC